MPADERDRERDRRRRAAAILGDVVPTTTRDESGEGWSERGGDRDDDLRRDVPPHHGS
ncbi:hypothetical protein CLV56_1136 [Mumia flava]|uniref:Uncharacterized protein n=1 Tax=Mumia flava TaxID=1348852 RepID=A0A2M9BG57_9ACTN|nr:hypothetical protein [Mumia flava]PJJ56919.1 hypothetical protein CLV56_1136 [Mumia flava]